MRRKVRIPASAVLAVYLIAELACAKRPPNLTPAQNAEYTVGQSLAILAQSNEAATSTAIKLNQLALVSKATTDAILVWTEKISKTHRQAVGAMRSGETWAARSAAILKLVGDLKVLPTEVSALLGSSATDQGIKGLIGLIQSIQTTITTVTVSTGGQ
jgi:type IV pilus biogenesis protein CpaD/CtpE